MSNNTPPATSRGSRRHVTIMSRVRAIPSARTDPSWRTSPLLNNLDRGLMTILILQDPGWVQVAAIVVAVWQRGGESEVELIAGLSRLYRADLIEVEGLPPYTQTRT